MGLSRLDNFLKSVRGTILYVNPDSLDSTDSIENTGSSPTRPFKTIQRAVAEAVRYSYQIGKDNDRFDRTTILLSPGEHLVDNRPGYIPDGSTFKTRGGETVTDLVEWSNSTSFNLVDPNNALYKLNSVHGGVILPRGVSIVGQDLRKTTIRPLYVPDPRNTNIKSSAIFKVTGGCFIYGFTIFDADTNGICYKDYTKNTTVPNFSHHKLNAFEFADGVNAVDIDDDFLSISTTRTDLDMLYEKIGLSYGQSSGRIISPDYPSANIDIEPIVDEFRIVGTKGREIGISSIFAGDSVTSTTTITVSFAEAVTEISTDTPIQIQGVSFDGYNGQYVVSAIPSNTTIQYKVQNPPQNPAPTVSGATVNVVVDSVTSASPYIFNCSLRSVYGMCGLLADGSKASGFKSMVVAQYTGIGLQKDANAFIKYDQSSGIYLDSTDVANLPSDSRSVYKPSYENYHIKATNDSFLQLVSVFSIGFAQHLVAESGGDFSITNSNSNFGAKALISKGYRDEAFSKDNLGYFTHIIAPKELDTSETSVEFLPIDVAKTISIGNTSRLYLYGFQNTGDAPNNVIDGYRIGAKEDDALHIQISQGGVTNTYSAKIVMPNTEYGTRNIAVKDFIVNQTAFGINVIGVSGNNVIDLTSNHTFLSGEKIKVISENGVLPDGILPNYEYYAITSSVDGALTASQIKLAQSENNAINNEALSLNSSGGRLHIVSKVIDKKSGDYGHPIQNDSVNGGWYINVSGISTENTIYSSIVGLGTAGLGEATSRSYVTRRQDDRKLNDKIFKIRYVIPKDSVGIARPPLEGYVLQEASSGIGTGTSEIQKYFASSASLNNSTELKEFNFISHASWSSNVVTVTTEIPHNLSVGSEVKIQNITPVGYNGTYTVTGTTSSRKFTYALTTNPGVFGSDTTTRNANLPRFLRKKYNDTYFIYRTEEIQEYVPNSQDGVYHLTVINGSNSPTITPFTDQKFSQPIQNLYPQLNRDNPNTNPKSSKSVALPSPIGQVVVNDPERSITKETLEKTLLDNHVGAGITNIVSTNSTTHVIYTNKDHEFAGIATISTTSAGSNYLEGTYYGVDLVGGTGSSASAKVTVNASGNVSAVSIMHPGGGYVVGDSLSVVPPVGIGTTTGFAAATIQVGSVRNSINDVISVYGISNFDYENYNTNYRITSISGPKQINVVSTSPVTGFAVSGIGLTVSSNASYIKAGKTVSVSTITYNSVDGTAVIGFTTSHGFRLNQKIILSGANDNFFNREFVVSNLTSVTSATINTGISTSTPLTTGTIIAYRAVLTSSFSDDKVEENKSGRLSYNYAGITTVTGSALNFNNTTVTIPNAVSLGLKLGDYLLISDEIFRIRTTVSGNTISVFRSLFGSPRQTHPINSVVRTINVKPIELRRNSIIRASGHTFEYLGFGPGNYSSALPERQDRILSPSEEILSQSIKYDGGAIVFSGMNSDGDFYTGNKIIRSSTGQEEVYNSPIPSISGEESISGNVTSELISSSDLIVFRSLKVEGGSDKNLISEFSGPVTFNDKISSSSGIEARDLYLQGEGEISRKFTVSNEKPDYAGNYGDVVFNSEPKEHSDSGWIYTVNNDWSTLSKIGESKIGVSTGTFNNYVGVATQLNFVGYGITFDASLGNTGIATVSLDVTPIWNAINAVGVATTAGIAALDDISGSFNGITTSFPLTVGTAPIAPANPFRLLIGLGGIIQSPNESFTISGTNIIFHSAPQSNLEFYGTILGTASFNSTPSAPNKTVQYNNGGAFGAVRSLVYNDITNSLQLSGSTSGALLHINQTGGGHALTVEDFCVAGTGYVGLGSTAPTAKLDIVAPSQQAIKILSTSGSGNIITIENEANDTKPIIFDVQGNLGINTTSATEKLSVHGNVSVSGDIRVVDTNTAKYIGFQAPVLGANYTYRLPNSYGRAGQVLGSNGEGNLFWTNNVGFRTSNVVAGTGITIDYRNVIVEGPGVGELSTIEQVVVNNAGVRRIVAGTGVTISPSTGVGDVVISATGSGGAATPYPFTTRGFSIPI
jgi:hypothetical protein